MVRLACLFALSLVGCSTATDEYQPSGPPDETGDVGDGGKEDGPAPGPDVPLAQQSADVGQFFMVDHYGVSAAGIADVRAKIKTKNLGAIILWNPTGASGETLRTMIRGYSQLAASSGRDELFYAADQEELHTQRFARTASRRWSRAARSAPRRCAIGCAGCTRESRRASSPRSG